MSLATRLLEGLSTGDFAVGLSLAGSEVSDVGYARQPASLWQPSGSDASTTVQFGPFTVGTRFDRVDLYEAGALDRTADIGETVLSPGAVWTETVTVAVG